MELNKQKLIKELDNFWYYYKIHVVVGVCILAIILYIVLTNNPVKNSALNVVMIGNTGQAQQHTLQKAATEKILGKNTDSIIKMSFWPVKGELTSPENGARQQKLIAMIGAKDIDVLVMDKQAFLFYAKQGTFLKLDSLKQEFPKEARFLKAQGKNKGRKYIYGIKIGQNHRLQSAGYDTKNKVLGIVANTGHQKRSIQFVRWLLQHP